MPGPKLKVDLPEVAACIDRLYGQEPEGWRKTRLLMVKLVARGESTSAQIAELCGIARGHVFVWLRRLREQGLAGLLERGQPGPKAGSCRGVAPKVLAQLRAKLEAHEFANVAQVCRWLKKAHGVERPYASVWNWLKKIGGVLRVPRPSHSRKEPGAEKNFQADLEGKLVALGLAAGSRLKVWVMDEARFGLHTQLRRVWTLRGQRPIVTRQIRYQWDYLYGALAVLGGEAHFAHLPGVGLAWDESYLADLAASDPQATHVLLRAQAGFHLRDGDPRLPERVRIIDLPPYCPELNPLEQLWDILRDDLANQVWATVPKLRGAMRATLRRFWEEARAFRRLLGRPWLELQLNATHKTQLSF